MENRAFRSLVKDLVRRELVSKAQIEECLPELTRKEERGKELLKVLMSKQYLTPFQVERIKRLDIDTLVLGGHKLLYENAAGSFARVYRGQTIKTGQTIGLKVLRNRWAEDKDTVELFRREAQIGQGLKHDNIVPIYDVGEERGQYFFTMEFVEGGNLKDFIKIRGKIEPLEAIRYVTDMARGLEYALSKGLTHRDLKTTNVLMSSTGVAKLIDFGLAADDEIVKKVGDHKFQQALEYTTLEKGTEAPKNDPRSDLFFLGAIFYEMLAGTPPYAKTKSREERKQISRYRDLKPLLVTDPTCPAMVADVVERLLHINPSERFQSPTDLINELIMLRQRLTIAANEKKAGNSGANMMPTILCVETRDKHQNVLRDYLGKRGFRVLILSNPDRAVARLETNPPQCMVMMGDSIEQIEHHYKLAFNLAAKSNVNLLLVLGSQQQQMVARLPHSETARIVVQPIALRDLRQEIENLIGHADQQESKSDSDHRIPVGS